MKDDELLTIDALHQYAYCPRRAFLMHVEGLMEHNAFTEDGKRVHRRIDRVDQALHEPASEPEPGAGGDEPPRITRSVALGSGAFGITGKLDLVSTVDDEAVPVETKRGRVPDNAEQSWEPERIQLMAQGLLLRDHGWRADHGFIYYAESRRRVEISFSPELEARTLEMIRLARTQRDSHQLPDPLEDSPKCRGCSVAGLCLPDETHALRHASPDPAAPGVRRLYPARSAAMPLYVQEQGALVGVRAGVLRVTKNGEVMAESRLKDLDHLVLCGNVQISAQALHVLAEAGVPVCHHSTGHWFYGMTSGFTLRNAYGKAAQFKAVENPSRRIEFARAAIAAKISNQRTILMRNGTPRPQPALDGLAAAVEKAARCIEEGRLLGIEGNAARIYFGSFPTMIKPADIAEHFAAEGREKRPPPDPLNACLSFGYAMLAKDCTIGLAAAGLDPFWGLYHKPRHGRPALALDLMEEFRPLVVDSAVVSAFNTGMLRRDDFIVGKSGCILKDTARKALIRAYELRMDQLATHPTLGYRVSWRVIVRLQAKLLGRWLRGDIPSYPGIRTR